MGAFYGTLMDRAPITLPLPCFGSGPQQGDAECRACQLKTECDLATGVSGTIPLAEARFEFLPEGLAGVKWTAVDELQQTYRECFQIVFKKDPPDNIGRRPEVASQLLESCRRQNVTPRLAMLTSIYGYAMAHPNGKFFCTMLIGSAADNRLNRWRAAVEDQYGTFTGASFDRFAGDEVAAKSWKRVLIDAEELAGRWAVGYALRHGTNACAPFWQVNEFSQHELWCAIEPSYAPIVTASLGKKSNSPQLDSKRAATAATIGRLKKDSKRAVSLFKLREAIMPDVVKAVLQDHGRLVEDFRVKPQPVTDVFKFWSQLGVAIQHVWCLEFLHGNKRLAQSKLQSGAASVNLTHYNQINDARKV